MLRSLLLLTLALPPVSPGPIPVCANRLAARAVQEPEDPKARLAQAMRRVRDKRVGAEERVALLEEVLVLDLPGAAGPLAAVGFLERDLPRRRKAAAKEQAALVEAFTSRAARVMKERLTKEVLAQVEADRTTVLENARDSGLTKERIRAESDPALERLEETLSLTLNQAWDADEDLFERYVAHLDALEEEVALYAIFGQGLEALEAAGQASRVRRAKRPEDPNPQEPLLLADLRLAAERTTPMTAKDSKALDHNAAVQEGVLPQERAGCARLDRIRILLGLGALTIDPKLCAAGRDHSKDMAELGFFAHDSPVPGKETPWKRAANFKTSAGAENIAAGASTGEGSIRQWWYSPGHHRNMLGSGHGRQGLGRYRSHWTQLFGG